MASQPVIEAAARESRANAREDMAVLTSGAREKVDGAMASMQAFGQTVLHPFDKKKKEDAQAAAEEQKKTAREKRDEIRSIAAQQATTERAAARTVVAKGVSEAGGARYPVVSSDPPQQLTGLHGNNYQPNQPSIMDQPFDSHSDIPVALHADDRVEAPHNQNLVSGESGTRTSTPKPAHGLSEAGGVCYPVVSSDPPQQLTGLHGNNYRPNQPSIMDQPFDNHSDIPVAIHADDRVEAPYNQNLVSGESGTRTSAPKPVHGLSRESKSGEYATQDIDTKGVEDADFYPPPRIVQT